MKKEYKMLKEKQELVNLRKDMVRKACDTLLSDDMNVFKTTLKDVKEEIYQLTKIPVRTLERSPYKEIINKYRLQLEECESSSIKILKKEIEYKNKIIAQLRKQNRALETQLLMEDKI
jgi:hypothetical protein